MTKQEYINILNDRREKIFKGIINTIEDILKEGYNSFYIEDNPGLTHIEYFLKEVIDHYKELGFQPEFDKPRRTWIQFLLGKTPKRTLRLL